MKVSISFAKSWLEIIRGPERKQLIAWLLSVGIFAVITYFGSRLIIDEPAPLWLVIGLYLINSIVFLALYRQFPKLGVVMLIYIYMFDLALFGYFFFTAASFGG